MHQSKLSTTALILLAKYVQGINMSIDLFMCIVTILMYAQIDEIHNKRNIQILTSQREARNEQHKD